MGYIPFILRIEKNKDFEGVDVNIYGKLSNNSAGFDVTGVFEFIKGNSKGVNITGVAKAVEGNSKGADLTGGIKGVGKDSAGFDITGLYKHVGENSKGVSITGGVNYSKGVEDFLIQYATLGNIIKKDAPEDAFVMQIGLYNKIGKRQIPILNIKGIKNIPKLIKKAFSKKKLEDRI